MPEYANKNLYGADAGGQRVLLVPRGGEIPVGMTVAGGDKDASRAAALGLAIEGYDDLSESEILELLGDLDPAELAAVQEYERTGESRGTIITYGRAGADDVEARLAAIEAAPGLLMRYRGEWSSATDYEPGDVVTHSGFNSFVAQIPRTAGDDEGPSTAPLMGTFDDHETLPLSIGTTTRAYDEEGSGYYHVEVIEAGTLAIAVASVTGDHVVTLLAPDGEEIATTSGAAISAQELPVGRHYIVYAAATAPPSEADITLTGTVQSGPRRAWAQLAGF